MNEPSRRDFLTTTAAGLGSGLLHREARADSLGMKRISVSILAAAQDVADFISWRLWDPYFLEVGIPEFLADDSSRSCDLLILGDRGAALRKGAAKRAKEQFLDQFLAGLPLARGVIAVQPASLKAPLTEALASRFGVRFRKWDYETPAFSIATEHPVLRPLARTAGQSLLPHLTFEWHMDVEPMTAEVVSRFNSGQPDILLRGRSALITSNLIHEVLQYHRHPDTLQFSGDLSAILVNLARVAAGAELLTAPVSNLYLDWRNHFYGYGYGRKFIFDLLALKGEAVRPEARNFVAEQTARSDELVAAAGAQLLREDVPAMQAFYREAAEGLLQCRKALVSVQPYFIRGWHGGLLSDQVVEGELVGYAEWGWPSRTMKWTEDRLSVSERLGYKQINQVGGATWDQIADHGLTDLERWKKASAAGLIESVKGMYSDAYLEVLGPESNIRQFEYGLKAFRRMSQGVRTFMVATDDYAFHPQLPQILKSFGFEFAALRPGGPGRIKGVDCEQLLWKGLDGTCIQAVPDYESVPQTLVAGGGINHMPAFLVAAEKAGFRTAVGGGAVDDTVYMYGEREYESLNSVVPVQAVPTTWPEYCQIAPIKPEPVFFDADDMLGNPSFWSGYGHINRACHDDRRLERLLVAAEKFSTLAMQKGRPYPAQSLEKAWKYLLCAQDHFSYGAGGPDNPEGYHSGGLQEGGMRGYAGPRIPITMEAMDLRWKNYAEKAGREALDGALSHLCRVETESGAGAGGPHLLVFNPLNWSRQGVAQAWVRLPSGTHQIVAFDGERETAAVILERRGEETLVEFHARVPSLGFRAYAIRPGTTKAGTPSTHLENQYLRVEVNQENGAIVSLFDKIRGKELLRTGEAARIECSQPGIDTRQARAEVKLDRADAVANRIRVQGKLAKSSYTLLLTLAHESPWLEVELEIDYGKGAIFGFKMRPETLLRAVFPFSPAGTRWVNLPFGVYRTAVDNPVMLDFCDACDGAAGVAILSDGMPGLHLADGNVEVLISDGFPPLRGVHRYRFGIYSHAGDWHAGNVLRATHEFQEKLPALVLSGAIPLPFERAYLETSDGVVLSALSMNGGKMHARFYDATGASQHIETRWRVPWKDANAVRLDGQPERELPLEGERIRFDLPAWRILTIAGSAPEGGQA
jgi:hypothetical protein